MLLTVHTRLFAKLTTRTLQATSHPAVVSRAPAMAPYPNKQHFMHVYQHLSLVSLVSTAATPSQQNSSRQIRNLTKGITSNHSITNNRNAFARGMGSAACAVPRACRFFEVLQEPLVLCHLPRQAQDNQADTCPACVCRTNGSSGMCCTQGWQTP